MQPLEKLNLQILLPICARNVKPSVINILGSSNKKKYRAIFYYLLVKELGAESAYEVIVDNDKAVAKKEPKKKDE